MVFNLAKLKVLLDLDSIIVDNIKVKRAKLKAVSESDFDSKIIIVVFFIKYNLFSFQDPQLILFFISQQRFESMALMLI